MSDQYLGEIRAFGFNFAPYGWFQCNGQTLPISSYAALFSLLGTYYGGNGTTNFQLPNLQGSVPMHWGSSTSGSVYDLGEMTGSTGVTLIASQVPSHSHMVQVAEGTGATKIPAPTPTAWLGIAEPGKSYIGTGTPNVSLSPAAIAANSGGQPHENMQPFLTVNFCIAFQGAFPPRG